MASHITFIRKDTSESSITKTFENTSTYDSLQPNDIIEIICEDGSLRDYYVEEVKWQFGHFGNKLTIIINPWKVVWP